VYEIVALYMCDAQPRGISQQMALFDILHPSPPTLGHQQLVRLMPTPCDLWAQINTVLAKLVCKP